MSKSKNAGLDDIPERNTPEAVILLLRLARAHPGRRGELLDSQLIDLAGTINARLPADRRIRPDDARLREPIPVKGLTLAKYAGAVIVKYFDHPVFKATVNERSVALVQLTRYYIWSHALRIVADQSLFASRDFEPPDVMNMVDDLVAHTDGAIIHWMAALCTVIDGWNELGLPDAKIEACLAEGSKPTERGTHLQTLEAVRDGAFRFRVVKEGERHFADWGGECHVWAIGLDEEFERFFRAVKDGGSPLHRWAARGVELRDVARQHPVNRPGDPLAAAERLMSMLLEPLADGAHARWTDIIHEKLADGDPAPWVTAVLSLRNAGSLSADESMHFLFHFVIFSFVGLDDPELGQLDQEMRAIEVANGIGDDLEAAETLPEWNAVSERHERRLGALRAAYFRSLGAHEAAALLEESYEAFEQVAERGGEEYHSRWSAEMQGTPDR